MFKKILFTILILLMGLSTIIVGFRLFEPKEEIVLSSDNALVIDYASLDEYLKNSPESDIHYLFFYNENDADSLYIRNTILTTVENETHIGWDGLIEIVDLSNVSDDFHPSELKDKWNINDYPAFLQVMIVDGELQIDHILVNTSDDAITVSKLITWLEEVGLYANEE